MPAAGQRAAMSPDKQPQCPCFPEAAPMLPPPARRASGTSSRTTTRAAGATQSCGPALEPRANQACPLPLDPLMLTAIVYATVYSFV